MPVINFSFRGDVVGATITQATNGKGVCVDVSGMSAEELSDKLNRGELFISLGDYLYDNSQDAEIEIFDFTTQETE